MEKTFDILIDIFHVLLGINCLCYFIAFIKSEQALKFIFLYIAASTCTEILSYLLVHDIISFVGKKTNAPFFFLFIIAQFLSLAFFFKNVLNLKKWMFHYNYIIIVTLVISISPYVIDNSLIMTFTPWAAFITFPIILLLSSIYFIDLLDDNKGYPFINIGIFISLGCSLINFVSFNFQQNVHDSIKSFKHLLHILPLIGLHILFLYECLLYFKSQIRR